MTRIAIAGDGAWGRALAHVARSAGHDTMIWSRRAPAPLGAIDALLLAIPAQACRDVLERLDLAPDLPVIVCAKGIERSTGLLMADVVRDTQPHARPMCLSGPSFAADVLAGLPTAVTLAAHDLNDAKTWSAPLSLPHFRIYASDDLLGVELGGALKNVLAIACGISDGRKLGDSARAALTARGFAELSRFGRALGARPETLTGLSGLGDLLLTCASAKSRNYAFGLSIGSGRSPPEALAASTGVVEGAFTAKIACDLAEKHAIDVPIMRAVHAIVDRGADPGEEIAKLLARPPRAERDVE